jgi:hypothetical protein
MKGAWVGILKQGKTAGLLAPLFFGVNGCQIDREFFKASH